MQVLLAGSGPYWDAHVAMDYKQPLGSEGGLLTTVYVKLKPSVLQQWFLPTAWISLAVDPPSVELVDKITAWLTPCCSLVRPKAKGSAKLCLYSDPQKQWDHKHVFQAAVSDYLLCTNTKLIQPCVIHESENQCGHLTTLANCKMPGKGVKTCQLYLLQELLSQLFINKMHLQTLLPWLVVLHADL